jgi:hypothetical protein
MSQLNIGFHPDSESVSLGDLPSDGQYKLSPESIPPTSDQSIVAQSLNLDKSPRTTNDKKYDNDLSSEQKVLDVEVKHGESFEDDDSYYSLKHFRDSRRGNRAEDSGLSRPIRRFYKDQDELIDVYERMHNHGKGNEESNAEEKQKYENTQRMSRILTKVSFVANVVCIIDFFFVLINKISIISYCRVYLDSNLSVLLFLNHLLLFLLLSIQLLIF